MGDVITRFRLENTQFDSKLRDSAKALQNIAHQAQLGGKDFNDFSQKAIETARALGTVQSGANNTKDKLRDLVGSYNDAAKAYNSLSETAKQGEFGKAMAASLQKLQQDIKDTKEEFYSLGEAASGKGGGLFGEGGLTGMLQVAGGNLISKGIEKIVGGLTETWQKSIELARAGEGVRIAFERLNQPDLLDKLKEATHGTVSEVELMKQAIKFENFKLPLEDLATYLAFAQQKAKDTGESVDYMVTSITTGLGRQSKQILDNLGISAAELTKRMNEGADMTKAVADIIREEMAKAGDYVETAADRAALAAAKATDEMEKFGRSAAPIAEEWGQVWNALSIGAMDFANTLLGPVAKSIRSLQNIWNNGWEDSLTNSPYNIEGKSAPKTGYQGMGNLQRVQAPGGYVEVTDKNTGAVIGGQHFDNLSDTNSINAWRKGLVKTPKTGGKGGSGRGGSIKTDQTELQKNQQTINTLTQEYVNISDNANEATRARQEEIQKEIQLLERRNNLLKLYAQQAQGKLQGGDIQTTGLGSGSFWGSFKDMKIEGLSEDQMEKVRKGMQGMNQTASESQKTFMGAASAVSAMGSALSSIKDPGVQIMGMIGQAIASIALGFAQASAKEGKGGIWYWIAATAAGLATMIATISSIHSATGYAQGGIVKGNSYSGDNIYGGPDAMVNAGELVLTKAQQSTLASALQGNGLQNINIAGKIKGTDIILSIDRSLQLEGKQLLTWGR